MALIGRAVCTIGFVERPLVLGFAWWAVTGEPAPALPLALFFELFWLDLYPIGGFVPPMPAFPFLLLLFLCSLFGWESSSAIAFPLALSLPFAYAVPVLEMWQRNLHKSDSVRMLDALERNAMAAALPGRLLGKAIAWQLLAGLLVFTAACAATPLLGAVPYLLEKEGFIPLRVGWPTIYVVAALGAAVGLRIRRIYLVLFLAVLATGAAKFWL